MKAQFSLVLLVIIICCAGAGSAAPAAQQVPYCELVKTPQLYSGKLIRVRAIYKYGFEIQRLDPAACCPDGTGKIWVELDSPALLKKFPPGMGLALATFEGTFDTTGPYGDGGYMFRLTVSKIDKIEAVAKPSARGEPKWVPNCNATH
jgi:hypothetical protein